MIILRDKEFSSKIMQLISGAKKAMNKVITPIDNAGLKVGDKIKSAVGKKVVDPKFKFTPKTKMSINRETIGIKNNATKAIDTPIGSVIDSGIKAGIKRPDVAAVTVATQALTPVGAVIGGPVGAAMMAPGYAAIIPAVAKKPLISRTARTYLDKKATNYGKSNFSRKLRESNSSVRSISKQVTSGYTKLGNSTGVIPKK
jgi:hypothetical protein